MNTGVLIEQKGKRSKPACITNFVAGAMMQNHRMGMLGLGEEEGVFSEMVFSRQSIPKFEFSRKIKIKKTPLTLAVCLNMFFIRTVKFWKRTATVMEQ